jgi:hypothetical protein
METIDGLACIQQEENIGNFIFSGKLKEMILESNPGLSYYGRNSFPLAKVNHNLYFIIKPFKVCHLDNILRIYQDVKKITNLEFAAYPGQLKLFNVMHACIKIQTEDKTDIPTIIDAYKSKNVEFIKLKKIDNYTTDITTKEYVKMVQTEEFVYEDIHNKDISYLEIDKYLDWSEFKKLENIIKNTFNYRDFKASLVSIYKELKYREFISIQVKGGCDCGKLSEMREQFLSQLKLS